MAKSKVSRKGKSGKSFRGIKAEYDNQLIRDYLIQMGETQKEFSEKLKQYGWVNEKGGSISDSLCSTLTQGKKKEWQLHQASAVVSVLGISFLSFFKGKHPFDEVIIIKEFPNKREAQAYLKKLESSERTVFYSHFPSSVFHKNKERLENFKKNHEYYLARSFLDFAFSHTSKLDKNKKIEILEKMLSYFQEGGGNRLLMFFNVKGDYDGYSISMQLLQDEKIAILGNPFEDYVQINSPKLCKFMKTSIEGCERLRHRESVDSLKIMRHVLEMKEGDIFMFFEEITQDKNWKDEKTLCEVFKFFQSNVCEELQEKLKSISLPQESS